MPLPVSSVANIQTGAGMEASEKDDARIHTSHHQRQSMTDVRTGSAESESVDLAARNLQHRLMASGHERWEGDTCTICFLLIELPMSKHSKSSACCLKSVCNGCILATRQRGMRGCPFCRTPLTKDTARRLVLVQKRVDKGHAEAITFLGDKYNQGILG